MPYDILERLGEAKASEPLVNQTLGSNYDIISRMGDLARAQELAPPPYTPPKTWFGEFTRGIARGTDELQQMGQAAGALGASWLGWDTARDWFIKGYQGNEAELAKNPASVPSYKDVNGLDTGIRYGLASVGELGPQIAESFLTGMTGAAVGTTAEPGGGTIAGGIAGVVGKAAVKKLLRSDVEGMMDLGVRAELKNYLEGSVTRDSLSTVAKTFATDESAATAKKWGADAAIALSSIAKEQGSIYGDLLANPNLAESDRRAAATVGGLVAAIPDTVVGSYIANKFFPGVVNVPKEKLAEASGYLARFAAAGAKEFLKVAGAEGAQEVTQTAIEVASKQYANPDTRYNFLHFDDKAWQEVIDSGLKGAIGGGIFGGAIATVGEVASQHPNPDVRAALKDIQLKVSDVVNTTLKISPEAKELEAVQNKITSLQTQLNSPTTPIATHDAIRSQLAPLLERENQLSQELGFATPVEPLVNQSSTTPTTPAPVPTVTTTTPAEPTPAPTETPKPTVSAPSYDQQLIERLRASYAQQTGITTPPITTVPGIDEKAAEKRAEIHAHIDTIATGDYNAALKAAFTPDTIRLLADQNVQVTSSDKYGYAVDVAPDGNTIQLFLPSTQEKIAGHDIASTLKSVAHEMVHVADAIAVRNEFEQAKANLGKTEFKTYLYTTWAERGKALREAYPSLPRSLKSVYNFGKAGQLSDLKIGQELPRMMVELARTGQITEATEALAVAAKSNNKLTTFARVWIRAIANIAATLRKFIDPATANPELLKVANEINAVLDKFSGEQAIPDAVIPQPLVNQNPPVATAPAVTETPAGTTPEPPVQAAASQPKPKTPLQKFKDVVRAKSGAIEVAHAYLDYLDSTKHLPSSNIDIAYAKQDLQTRVPGFKMGLDKFKKLAREKAGVLVNQKSEPKGAQIEQAPNPQAIATATGLVYDGVLGGTYWQFTDINPKSPAFSASFYVPVGATQSEVETKHASKVAQFEGGAQKPSLPPNLLAKVNRLAEEATTVFAGQFNPRVLGEGTVRTEPRGGLPTFNHLTPQLMEYQSQPQVRAMAMANDVMQQKGLMHVIESLLKDPTGREFDLQDEDEVDGVPNAALRALHELTQSQLDHMAGIMERDGTNVKARVWARETVRNLEKAMRPLLTQAGRFTSITGKSNKVWNGYTARMDYLEPHLDAARKVLGANGRRFIEGLSAELNSLYQKYVDHVVTKAELTTVLSNALKEIKTKGWKQLVQRTIAANDKKIRRVAKKSAARMAEYVGEDELGNEWSDLAAKKIIKAMSGMPKAEESKTETQLFNEVVTRMAREQGEELGMVGPRAKTTKMSAADTFGLILRNEGLYGQFIRSLREKMLTEYKPEPGSQFAKQIEQFFGEMSNRMWRESMVESLVNEKLKEYETSIATLAKSHYSETEPQVSKLRYDIEKLLHDQGINNEGLRDQLVEDVESSMRSQVEEARLNFFGGTTGVKSYLTHLQTTLAAQAKEHASSATVIDGHLEQWLENEMGVPNTQDMPLAATIAEVMQRQLNSMVGDERRAILERWVAKAQEGKSQTDKTKLNRTVDKMMQLAALGVFRDKDAYIALQQQFDLPPYSEEVAKDADRLGETIAMSPNERLKDIYRQELTNLLQSQKGISTYDLYISALYVNMLSGPSTQLVNIFSNLSTMAGYTLVNAIQNPARIPTMLRALFRAATGVAQIEAREAFWTGLSLGKYGNKFFRGSNPLEQQNPVLTSKRSNPKLKALDEKAAGFVHKLYRGLKGNYIGRALTAADIFFYKINQEASFARRTGILGNEEMFHSAMDEARANMLAIGENPDDSSDLRRRQKVLAHQIFADQRLVNQKGEIDPNLEEAWLASHHEALDATFQQDPKGLLGKLAKLIEKWTEHNPIGKMLIPFTRVAANVTNHMLEWTPYGLVRFGGGHLFGEDFRLTDETGNVLGKDKQIAIRAMLGTAGIFALMALLGDQDDEDPYISIYADGPRDLNAKRQLMDRGWRPNTIKVGKSYFSYITTPFAIAFSIVGRMFDDFRDGKIERPGPTNISMSSSSVAILRAVMNQSFLASITDLMAAVDSPEPEKKMSRLFSRFGTMYIPNLAKQIDKWVDPTVQQADGFWETYLKEIPVARSTELKSMLNVFGEPVVRTPGLGFMPGMERFITMEKSDDPVYAVLGEKRLVVPGFSKSAKIGNTPMSEEQFYAYVKDAGPQIKLAIQAELPRLQRMTREEAEHRIEEIASEIKQKVRRSMRSP